MDFSMLSKGTFLTWKTMMKVHLHTILNFQMLFYVRIRQ